jgi:SAM-dependent methyltransferase
LDQVAEHVTDPNALFEGIFRILKPGGVAILTTPNAKGLGARLYGRRWLNWHTPYHLQFYTKKSLKVLAKNAGLVFRRRKIITASEWQYYQWRHILSYPAFGESSDFWAPGAQNRKPISRMADRLLGQARRFSLQQWISRALDIVRLGDNQLFFLRKP